MNTAMLENILSSVVRELCVVMLMLLMGVFTQQNMRS